MKLLMPQEIQVWHILPALRREFARHLVKDLKLNQKQAAKMLGVTEPAISQYFKSKRGSEIEFDNKVKRKIKLACARILNNKSSMTKELYDLSISKDVMKATCTFHKNSDSDLRTCNICFEEN